MVILIWCRRASGIFEHVIVAVGTSTQKAGGMALEQRVELCKKVLSGMKNVEVVGFTACWPEFVRSRNAPPHSARLAHRG